jgi:hypothetical protein
MELKSGRSSSYRVASVTAPGQPNEIGTLSASISERQARNVLEAVAFASLTKLPLDVFITIQWSKATPGGRPQDRLLRFFERVYQWLFRRNLTLAYVYVHEIGALGKPNSHIMIHVPASFQREFERMIPQWLDSPSCEGFIEVKPVQYRNGLVEYFLKGTEVEAAKSLGILRCSIRGRFGVNDAAHRKTSVGKPESSGASQPQVEMLERGARVKAGLGMPIGCDSGCKGH